MQFLESWPSTRETFISFWRGELERPVIQVTTPRADAADFQWFDFWAWLRHRDNPRHAIEVFEHFAARAYFGGEAYPNLWSNLGPGVLAAYYTGFLEFNELSQTAWFEKPLSWDEIEKLEFRPGNAWWQYTLEITRMMTEAGRGRFIVGTSDIGGVLDVLASLRGTQELLFDLIREPERVHAACRRIEADFLKVYDELDAIIKEGGQEGTSAWMGIWAPGRQYPLQCDFSAMISPGMFEEFVLPSLVTHCRALDQAVYHLDGPNQIPHVDHLLAIPELKAIQWVPGSGVPQCEAPQWFDLYRKILASGKRLILQSWEDPTKIGRLLDEVPHQGLLITTWAGTESDARTLVDNVQNAPASAC